MRCLKILLLFAAIIPFSLMAKSEETIRIGVAGPLTGAYAAFGEQLTQGVQQAAKDLGMIQGKRIEIIKLDDACEPKQAVAVATRAVTHEGIAAIVGHFCSSSTMPASEIYADEGILMVTPASTNPKITERGLTTVFRTCGRDDQQGVVAANFIVNKLKGQRVAVIHDKDTYGQGLADAMRSQLNALGTKEILYEGITRGEKDFNALVTRLKSHHADVVYFGGLHTEAGPLVRQMREQGLDAAFVSGDGIVSEDFVIAAGGPKFVDGVYMTFGADPRLIPEGQFVVERMRKNQFEPEGYTLYSYATMQVIAKAIEATNSTNGEILSRWLHNNPVNTVMGTKSWDRKGDLNMSDYVMYSWDNKGHYAQVN